MQTDQKSWDGYVNKVDFRTRNIIRRCSFHNHKGVNSLQNIRTFHVYTPTAVLNT